MLRARLVADASEPYRAAGRFAYHFARGKLGGDPAFMGLLRLGLFPADARILDLGCGQGLLAAWLLSARRMYDAGDWPADWPAPPRVANMRGIDLSRHEVKRARRALGGSVQFEEGDMRLVDFGRANVVVMKDAVHYVDGPAQDDILQRVRAALSPGGLFLARVGDAGASLGFQWSNWIDRTVVFVRGNGLLRLHCRGVPEWIRALESLGFRVEIAAMRGHPRLADVMLVARLGVTDGPPSLPAQRRPTDHPS